MKKEATALTITPNKVNTLGLKEDKRKALATLKNKGSNLVLKTWANMAIV